MRAASHDRSAVTRVTPRRRPIRFAAFAARLRRSRDGIAAVEFAMIAPIMLLMGAGVLELGWAFQSQCAVNRLASQYAIVWADCSDLPAGTCSTEMNVLASSNTVGNIVPQLNNSTQSLQMFQVKMNGSTPTVTYAYPSGTTLNATQTAAASATLSNGQAGVIVTMNYTHKIMFFGGVLNGVVPSTIPMSFTIAQLKA